MFYYINGKKYAKYAAKVMVYFRTRVRIFIKKFCIYEFFFIPLQRKCKLGRSEITKNI